MRLRSKVILAITPIVGAALVLTSWLIIMNMTKSSHDAVYRYSEGILNAYFSQDLITKFELLKKNKLDTVPSFVFKYQQEAFDAAKRLNLIWPGHVFIVNGKNIIYCSDSRMPAKLPSHWDELRKEVQNSPVTIIKGHVKEEEHVSYVARYFAPWNWVVVIAIQEDFLHEKEKTIWKTVSILGLVTFTLLIVSLVLILNKLFLQPVLLLRETTEQIAEEDAPVSIPIADGDELGELSRDIERMSLRIHESKVALRTAYEELIKLDEMKSALITNISHELRTPLTSILGFAKLGLKKVGKHQFDPAISIEENMAEQDETIRKNFSVISEQASIMSEMVDNIVILMSLISKDSLTDMVPLDIASLIRNTCETHQEEASSKGLALVSLAPSSPVIVTADSKMIHIVLAHFIDNAITFTRQGRIEVVLSTNEDEAQVEVRDTGIGMSEEDLTKAFEAFYQSGNILTEKPRGLGVGLSICHKIITLHGGRIWASSKEGKGSSFYFTLPLTDIEA